MSRSEGFSAHEIRLGKEWARAKRWRRISNRMFWWESHRYHGSNPKSWKKHRDRQYREAMAAKHASRNDMLIGRWFGNPYVGLKLPSGECLKLTVDEASDIIRRMQAAIEDIRRDPTGEGE